MKDQWRMNSWWQYYRLFYVLVAVIVFGLPWRVHFGGALPDIDASHWRLWVIFEANGVAGVPGPGDISLNAVCVDIERCGKGMNRIACDGVCSSNGHGCERLGIMDSCNCDRIGISCSTLLDIGLGKDIEVGGCHILLIWLFGIICWDWLPLLMGNCFNFQR